MENSDTLTQQKGIQQLKELISEIEICLFCTNLKGNMGSTCRPMEAQKVCDRGNIWFFSDIASDKTKEIEKDKNVQLFYSHPGKNSYLVVNGEAEIITDKKQIEDLWSPTVKVWFKEGKEAPNISIIKVVPSSAYYWDTKGNKMVNFFKMILSVVSETELDIRIKGEIKL